MITIYSAIYPSFAHLPELDGVEDWKVIFKPEHMISSEAILVLHGGSDISPSYYHEKSNKYVYADVPSPRDEVESDLIDAAVERGIPIFGICRGAQFLCIKNGGKLVQHVTNHQSDHRLMTNTGDCLKTNSAHHQMMFPFGTEHEMLAWSNRPISERYLGEKEQELNVPLEPEIVYYPKLKGLGIQGHPEWLSSKTRFVQYCLKLAEEKLVKNVIRG